MWIKSARIRPTVAVMEKLPEMRYPAVSNNTDLLRGALPTARNQFPRVPELRLSWAVIRKDADRVSCGLLLLADCENAAFSFPSPSG